MTDVGKRDAMSISSLLSEPAAGPTEQDSPGPTPAEATGGALPTPAPGAANGQVNGQAHIGGDSLPIQDVPLPTDSSARAMAGTLVQRITDLDGLADTPDQLADRLNKMGDGFTNQADMFVAYSLDKLQQIAEQRVKRAGGRKPKEAAKPARRAPKRKDGAGSPQPEGQPRKIAKRKDDPFVLIAPADLSEPRKLAPAPAAADVAPKEESDESGSDESDSGSDESDKRKRGDDAAGEKRPKREDDSRKEGAAELKRRRQYKATFEGIWRDIARKEIPKAHKQYVIGTTVKLSNSRKTATLAGKEARKWQVKTNRHIKDMQTKARRAMREMMSYWKRNEKEERDSRKKAEKEALDSARKQEEEREALRQSRKLNFLITQTELYSHFVGSKTGQNGPQEKQDAKSLDFDNADDAALRAAAEANAQSAVARARSATSKFDEPAPATSTESSTGVAGDDDFQNPESLGDKIVSQPKLLSCELKEYQLKGLTWLANLYEQGINGILADEMGLGKTVQSISVMAYLAEMHNIWGPFLVVAPASTLHNWQQEITKFVPEFKVLPYWGSNKDRKVLRKFWDRKQLRYTKDSPFHVLVTSYQLIVSDAQYFNRIKWQYMILDEAQAIKSSSSTRWKSLLSMQCRNRLLLTGTPIQNSMQELWALLHFIMPTLFDSHEEFSDWFSKDIESHATKNKELNENQLRRLHMILKPFMLRRVKKHVQQELGDKIEADVYCNLTPRQRVLYKLVKSQVSIRDLIEKGTSGDEGASLMNLVMQFRKVCNHPDLFERQDVISAFSFATFGNTTDYLRETNQLSLAATARNPVELALPKLFASDSGVLDLPGPQSDSGVRERVLNKFKIGLDPLNEYTQSISAASDTPVAGIVRAVQQNLLERTLDEAPKVLEVAAPGSVYEELTGGYVSQQFLVDNYVKEMDPGFRERATAPPITFFIPERAFYMAHDRMLAPPAQVFPLTLDEEWRRYEHAPQELTPGYLPDNGRAGLTTISVPSMAKFIADSGKLKKLDELLVQLKKDDHRVLIYFQMTKMMDLMEEYLTYRQYKYLRLDGSSKLGDRRDLVNDWQTRPELFVFLLSTRAGGLGINLTAADTVVFFDSDWNPTIDSQAMDRAHRLGQTRQVTVYRLLVRGTIEERMRNRAKQKEQVQTVVMEGSKAAKELAQKKSKDDNQYKDVAFWLLDDEAGSGGNPSFN